LVLVWQLNAQWKFDPAIHTEVEVRFTALDAQTTRVDLEHRGLDVYGGDALAMRDAFAWPEGWNGMLDHFAAVTASVHDGAAAR